MNRQARSTGGVSMTLLLFVGLAAFIAWASVFEIEETVHATGQIVPLTRTQIIQAADGGVLSEILVKEGQSVKAGQRIAVLEKDRSNAAFEEARDKVGAIKSALARATAEATAREPDFGQLGEQFAEFVRAQKRLYDQRKRGLSEELAPLRDSLEMAKQELQMNEVLLKDGDASQVEVMRARRQVNEIQARINAASNKYRQDARAEVTKLEEELSSATYKLEERQSVLDHTDMVAPVAGIIKFLRFNTVGGVLRPGDEMMQISPTDGAIVVEIKVMPVDIGNLKLGLPVVVKLDAYDYSIYGTLKGDLVYISSDTLSDQSPNGQNLTYYRAHVRITEKRSQTNQKLASVEFKPGMTASVDVQTRRRTVLQYLVKPVMKAFGGAMSER
jgi:membrane fusion protein, adhesin transport system